MASSIVITIGTVSETLDLTASDTKVVEILRLYIKEWSSSVPEGMTVAQQNRWAMRQVLNRIRDSIKAEAQRVRMKELRDAQASLEETATSETQL